MEERQWRRGPGALWCRHCVLMSPASEKHPSSPSTAISTSGSAFPAWPLHDPKRWADCKGQPVPLSWHTLESGDVHILWLLQPSTTNWGLTTDTHLAPSSESQILKWRCWQGRFIPRAEQESVPCFSQGFLVVFAVLQFGQYNCKSHKALSPCP